MKTIQINDNLHKEMKKVIKSKGMNITGFVELAIKSALKKIKDKNKKPVTSDLGSLSEPED